MVFFKDPSVAVDMPEDIVKLWRSVSVEGMDAKKIADHLAKSGFSFIKNELKAPVSNTMENLKIAVWILWKRSSLD